MSSDQANLILATLDGPRIQLARELRSLTQAELAQGIGVTAAAVSQFEHGHTRPSAATLTRLAQILEVPLGFFARRPGVDPTPQATFFRSLRSTTAREQRRATAVAALVHEFAHALTRYVSLPEVRVPTAALARTDLEIERAAVEARRAMGLDDHSPVAHMVRVLEEHGAVTARIRVQSARVDAYSVAYEDRPVIVLGDEKGYRDRSRFDAAHELGHIVLAHGPSDVGTKIAEAQAHLFASCFLMPRAGIAGELPSRADWHTLMSLKLQWQVSLAALLKRAQTLGVMDDNAYTQAMKAMSARRWRNPEPVDLGAPETPMMLATAVRIADQHGVNLEQIAESRGLPVADLTGVLRPSISPKPVVTF